MSDLQVNFNNEAQAILKDAKKAFGMETDDQTVNLALMFLKFATQARSNGQDIATLYLPHKDRIKADQPASLTADEMASSIREIMPLDSVEAKGASINAKTFSTQRRLDF